jgi:hypothetical protein
LNAVHWHKEVLPILIMTRSCAVEISYSSNTLLGLKNVFDEAIVAALEPPVKKKSKKCIML